jgi:OmpA-OmpF porin, OOP family
MRCNWRRWLWGVIPLAGVGAAAVHLERAAIEKDLTERAQQALTDGGAPWAVVNFSGRDVVLTGTATSENEPVEAEATLRQMWGVRYVNNNAGLPPIVEPYLWSARRRGGRVRLTGSVPNRTMRQTIIGMTNAALPGLEVVDRMRVARGVPPTDTWLAGLSFALKQLAALKDGEVRLEDLALTIAGEAEGVQAYQSVSAVLKRGLPKGITLAGAQIAAPVVSPHVWSVQYAGGQLVLSGHVANDGAKAKLMTAAATAPSGTGVVDRMEPAGGAPEGWADAAAALIREIVRLQSGSADIKDTAVTVGGIAADEAQAQAIRDALRAALPAAFKLTDQVRVREPKVEPKPPEPAPPPAQLQAPAQPHQPPSDPQPAKDATAPASPPSEPPPQLTGPAAPPPAEPVRPAAEAAPAPAAPQEAAAPAPAAPQEAAAPAPAAPQEAAAPAPPREAAAPVPAAPAEATAPAAVVAAPTPAPPEKAAAPDPRPAETTGPAVAALPAAPPPEAAPKAEAAPPAPGGLAVCRADLIKLAGANPIPFDRGSAKIEAAGVDALQRIAVALKACPGVRIAVEGHADIEGTPVHNQKLSVRRAQAVADYLTGADVGLAQVETVGFGSSRPAAPNATAPDRAKNRRSEIIVRQ